MDIITRNNIKLKGRGEKAIIFSHGYGCNQNMWRLITPAFENDYQIVLLDLVGSGNSDTSAYDKIKYSSLEGYADDLVEVCQKLDLSQSIFVGHSVSSMIGILAANKDPSLFEKLILIGPSPCYINNGEYIGGFTRDTIDGLIRSLQSNYSDWAKAMAPVIMGNLNQPELGAELTQSFCQTGPEVAKHFAQVTFQSDNRRDLTKVQVPTLILQCSEDPIAPEVVGRYVHQHIKGSKFTLLKATGHCPHLSAPEETVAAIKAWFHPG
jgi:sigma-B regulation protein RsbQ